ncbi:MAG: carboxypeptidase regulatory-like domain-containing protein [Sediminibacterium sp.]|nr:carboxypeptidase regulatory-like domain-containing protein [Sediminibacterium sp.]
MKAVLLSFFIISVAISGCAGSHSSSNAPIKQGISGYLFIEKGNRMPSPDKPIDPPKGLKTQVFIHEVTNVLQLKSGEIPGLYSLIPTPLVATASSDSTGFFTIDLEPGSYSVFVKYQDGFYANWFNEKNQVTPVVVTKGSVTKVSLKVSIGATY